MTIIQITGTSFSTRSGHAAQVFGLGDDNKVYVWDNAIGEWRLWATNN